MEAASCNFYWVPRSHRQDAKIGPLISYALNIEVVCQVALFAKVPENVSVPSDGDLMATESNSDFRLLGPTGAVFSPSPVPGAASFVSTKCDKKSFIYWKPSRTRRKLARGSRVTLTVSLSFSCSSQALSSSQNRCSLVRQSWRLRSDVGTLMMVWLCLMIVIIPPMSLARDLSCLLLAFQLTTACLNSLLNCYSCL